MKINLANSHQYSLSNKKNKIEKLGSNTNKENEAQLKSSKAENSVNDLSPVSISISEKGKILFEKLNYPNIEEKQSQPLLERPDASEIESSQIKSSYLEDMTRLIDAAYKFDEKKVINTLSYSRLENEYKTMIEELNSTYTGSKLEEKLATLENSYSSALEKINDNVSRVIKFAAYYDGKEGVKQALNNFLVDFKFSDEEFDQMADWDNLSIMDAAEDVIQFFMEYIKKMSIQQR